MLTAFAAQVVLGQALLEYGPLDAAADFANPRDMDLFLPHCYAQRVCRPPEWPDAVSRAFAHPNHQVYRLMQGPREFGISGRLEHRARRA